jgi:CheY-like chemotaxis protein
MEKRVFALLDDLFFESKIRQTANELGINLSIIKSYKDFKYKVLEQKPNFIIIDLGSKKIDAERVIKEIKHDEELKNIFCMGYISHVEKQKMEKFQEMGCDQVLPRSRFSNQLKNLITETINNSI